MRFCLIFKPNIRNTLLLLIITEEVAASKKCVCKKYCPKLCIIWRYFAGVLVADVLYLAPPR